MMLHFFVYLASIILAVFGLEPRFNVITRNVTIISGQTAVLPCSVDYLGDYKVVWLNHRSKLLTLEDRRIIADERISIERPYVKEWNLYIRQVRPSDQGVYTCQINTDPVRVRPVWLQVQEPPQIIDSMPDKEIEVNEGETVSLVCNVTGVPTPTVTWYRIPAGQIEGDGKERIGIEGEVLVIHNVTRYCDDFYECVASNGVPPSVNKLIRVSVQFPPEIRLPNKKIGQAKGKETILECMISGYPQGVNVWRRDGVEITDSWKYRIELYDEGDNTFTLSLRIKTIDMSDYGEYECVASNKLGSDTEFMTLYEYPKYTTTTTTTTTSTTTSRPNRPGNDNIYETESGRRPIYVTERKNHGPGEPPYDIGGNETPMKPGNNQIYKPGVSGQVFDDKKNSAQTSHANSILIGLFMLPLSFLLQVS